MKIINIYIKNLLIIGAGESTSYLLPEIKKNNKYNIIGIVDDNIKKMGCYIHDVRIIGTRNSITKIVKEKNINQIIISAPSMLSQSKKEIIEICSKTGIETKIIPYIHDIAMQTDKLINTLRNITIEDLLDRDPIKLENDNIKNIIKDKVVLVTGGGGSIGSELCRQIVKNNPSKLIILDIYENNAYDIQNELLEKKLKCEIETIICDTSDRQAAENLFENNEIKLVFHAAAHKHVPLMENNPIRAIKNNICGTLNIAKLSDEFNVEKFILVSTDKAVNPTSVMGATKRICEIIVQNINRKSKTDFSAVRFGNVLGSNGSVIPLFKKQIEKGGPITVTHENIIRYFMTIPEAVGLILQATSYAKGGEIFILDMGTPVKIYDLAIKMIELTGLKADEDIKIKISGLRPGEKMYEELLIDTDKIETENSKIFIAKMPEIHINLDNMVKVLLDNESEDTSLTKIKLKKYVPEYKISK